MDVNDPETEVSACGSRLQRHSDQAPCSLRGLFYGQGPQSTEQPRCPELDEIFPGDCDGEKGRSLWEFREDRA